MNKRFRSVAHFDSVVKQLEPTCASPRSGGLIQVRTGALVANERIVAVALLTRGDVQRLGDNFNRLWPVDETPCFAGLIEAIDAADREVRQERAQGLGSVTPSSFRQNS